jgi:predicted nucleotidyltransferase
VSRTRLTPDRFVDLLRPPTDAEVAEALARFAAAVERGYGERLKGIYLFGSRARGDHGPDSDADVAVLLADDAWEFWDEKMRLVDLAFDSTHDSGLYVQPWPFTEREWAGEGARSRMARHARQDAKAIGAAV